MKPMKLVLASTAAAVLAAFNPAFAGGDTEYNKDSSASAQTNSDITAGANVGAGESSTDMNANSDSSVSSTESAAPSASSSGSGTTLGDSTAGAEPERDAALESERRLN